MADKIESSESQRNYSIALEFVNDLSNSQKQYQKLANSSQAKLTDYYKFANLLLKVYRVTNDGSIIKLSKEYLNLETKCYLQVNLIGLLLKA